MKTHFLNLNIALAVAAQLVFVGCASTHKDIGSTDHPSKQDAGRAPQMQLPAGWTPADMQAYALAGTPGANQQKLARGVGHWSGTSTMWMAPGMEPMKNPMTSTVSSIMDGRYTKTEAAGDMPGMGPFQGLGYYGYDNVAQKYVSTWLDNMGTGIMTGDGTLSSDGSTFTWNFHYTCPITKQPVVMREVEHYSGNNSMTLDMFSPDPKTGKEFKSMHIDLTRTSP